METLLNCFMFFETGVYFEVARLILFGSILDYWYNEPLHPINMNSRFFITFSGALQ